MKKSSLRKGSCLICHVIVFIRMNNSGQMSNEFCHLSIPFVKQFLHFGCILVHRHDSTGGAAFLFSSSALFSGSLSSKVAKQGPLDLACHLAKNCSHAHLAEYVQLMCSSKIFNVIISIPLAGRELELLRANSSST